MDNYEWVSLEGNSWRVRPEWRNIYSRTKINPAFYNGMKYDPYKPMIVVRVPEHIIKKLYGR